MIAGEALFEVLVNAAVTFVAAYLLVRLLTARMRDGGLRLALLCLPFAKVVYEVARGIPANAFFWERVRGVQQELGSFLVGVGFSRLGFILHISFSAHAHGRSYPTSVADGAATILGRRVATLAPTVVAVVLVLGAVIALARLHHTRFRPAGPVVDWRRLGARGVRIHLDPREGVPCAGGLLQPWICVPASVHAALSDEEREAVIAHELAHLRRHDVLLLGSLAALEAALWFVPFVGRLARAIGAQCELRADADARLRGVDGAVLASALVRVAERLSGRTPRVALIAGPSLLSRRVHELLAPLPAEGRGRVALRFVLAVVAATFVLRATTFGLP